MSQEGLLEGNLSSWPLPESSAGERLVCGNRIGLISDRSPQSCSSKTGRFRSFRRAGAILATRIWSHMESRSMLNNLSISEATGTDQASDRLLAVFNDTAKQLFAGRVSWN